MGIDPTLGIGDQILDHAHAEKKTYAKRSCYAICPSCGQRQFERDLLESGCFICKWKGYSEEVELGQSKETGHPMESKEVSTGYKKRCPRCSALLIAASFKENGCYICGYKED